ncbi:Anhydro-N-acetylmuramic acid kinase [Zhongshania aliphaticivorans]|uniref:Anhydro-N-acetylmuramic acid kinase n=1 Tax=Zhongshania aliphaticivorans TaxID=1470434 RepID=A0A5S9QCI5_9GAMM|nr:anhydro-N-acetylmuramic acid kinase [Zhongshania aliphaticivorans]CAA0114937.1 Anhydro-N-acetylmuramic acid kinase [Zhongshania aliphaticivorans]CAA0123061.1 Anhydro-N-acetylmuramic acid kinase [Zhongshania aliphaticivorans]
MSSKYIGLMSGTSLDGIDAALISIDKDGCVHFEHSISAELPRELKKDILQLCSTSHDEIELLGKTDRKIGQVFAEAALALCASANIKTTDVTAVGSHGQTVRHRPPDNSRDYRNAFTLQIGDPNTIAEISGITTVGDFRRRDIAAAGQGAPLVPAFHAAAFADPLEERIILNIGGMANVSILKKNGDVTGFDTGPGNVLMDSWIQHCQQLNYDRNGEWAASGSVDPALLQYFLQSNYYRQTGPKSTGREQFNMQTIEEALKVFPCIAAPDVQATLLELTARSICDAIEKSSTANSSLFLCGGGSANLALCQRLKILLPSHAINDTSALGIPPDWVEAVAFGWIAHQTLNHLPGNIPAVTGAKGSRILGAIYPA